MNTSTAIQQTKEALNAHLKTANPIGIILGTGLGGFAREMNVRHKIPYADIPNFPQSTVKGHAGALLIGEVEGVEVVALMGRFHFYEGYDMEQVVYPVRVMHALGVKTLLLSNASGGMNPDFSVGDIMLITDQINLMPSNPLLGKNDDELGPRFPDMSEPYDKELAESIRNIAKEKNIRIREGVYAGVSGPCFETPAEYKYIRIIGGDAVGMSTVPECIAAKHLGMRVAALSVITDLGVEGIVEEVSHEEVMAAAAKSEPLVAELVKGLIRSISAV